MQHRIPPPEPGVYRDVPMDVYNAWNCARSSTLGALARGATPYELKTKADNQTPSKGMGSALHLAIWEPHLFQSHTEVWTDTKTRAKGFLAHQEAMPDGHYLLTSDEATAVAAMVHATKLNKRVASWLRAVEERELSVIFDLEVEVFDDQVLPHMVTLRCKARLDGLAPKMRAIVDLKSTQSAAPVDFSWSIKRYGYHHQGAIYLAAAAAVAEDLGIEPPTHHVIIAVQNEPTHRALAYRLQPEAIELAWAELTPAIAQLATCYETNVWPDTWPGFNPDATMDITLPEGRS